jgi:hypothetical protein
VKPKKRKESKPPQTQGETMWTKIKGEEERIQTPKKMENK